jgi:ArsR family transcriptional regulator, arsenate/arsenite/antimonite-responsive transcriptional repressor
MTDLFSVLADDTRRAIVSLLRGTVDTVEMSVGELVDALGITQPTVSKHLKVLRDAGLVSVREEGQHRYYSFDPTALRDVRRWVQDVAGTVEGDGAEPFVDLTILGRATGSLVSDTVARLESVLGRLGR